MVAATLWAVIALALACTEIQWANRRRAITGGAPAAVDRAARASDDALLACYAIALGAPVLSAPVLGTATSPAWVTAGALLGAGGVVLRVAAMRALGRRFMLALSMQPDDPRLVRDRCYGVVRHPGYTALLLVAVGLAWISGGPVPTVWVVPAAALVVARIRVEETMLAREFGQEFDDYRSEVSARLMPRVW